MYIFPLFLIASILEIGRHETKNRVRRSNTIFNFITWNVCRRDSPG
jgi:hypothetical protein